MTMRVIAGTLVTAVAIAATPIENLNNTIKEMLAPFQNRLTVASMEFKDLKTDDKRALKADVVAHYKRSGELTELEFTAPTLNYDYTGHESGPLVNFDLQLNTELDQILDRDLINEIAPLFKEMLQEEAEEYLEDFGPAASIDIQMDELKYVDGNLERIAMSGTVKIDLSKLPEDIEKSEVPLIEAQVSLEGGIAGLKASGHFVMNKDFYTFHDDEEGLKEWVDNLLKQDEDTMEEIQELFEGIDEIVKRAVNDGFKDEDSLIGAAFNM